MSPGHLSTATAFGLLSRIQTAFSAAIIARVARTGGQCCQAGVWPSVIPADGGAEERTAGRQVGFRRTQLEEE